MLYRLLKLCKNPLLVALLVENPCVFGCFTGFLLAQERRMLGFCTASIETVQKTSLGYAGGKPNPLNPPYQGGLSTQFPPDKGG